MSAGAVDVLVACRNCGSRSLSWAPSYVVKSGLLDGRLCVRDVSCVFALGCDECSETLRVIDAEAAGAALGALAELIEVAKPCADAYEDGVPTRMEIERLVAAIADAEGRRHV